MSFFIASISSLIASISSLIASTSAVSCLVVFGLVVLSMRSSPFGLSGDTKNSEDCMDSPTAAAASAERTRHRRTLACPRKQLTNLAQRLLLLVIDGSVVNALAHQFSLI